MRKHNIIAFALAAYTLTVALPGARAAEKSEDSASVTQVYASFAIPVLNTQVQFGVVVPAFPAPSSVITDEPQSQSEDPKDEEELTDNEPPFSDKPDISIPENGQPKSIADSNSNGASKEAVSSGDTAQRNAEVTRTPTENIPQKPHVVLESSQENETEIGYVSDTRSSDSSNITLWMWAFPFLFLLILLIVRSFARKKQKSA